MRAGFPSPELWTAEIYTRAYAAGMPVAIAGDRAKMLEWLNAAEPPAPVPPMSLRAAAFSGRPAGRPLRPAWIAAAALGALVAWWLFFRKRR